MTSSRNEVPNDEQWGVDFNTTSQLQTQESQNKPLVQSLQKLSFYLTLEKNKTLENILSSPKFGTGLLIKQKFDHESFKITSI